MKRNPYLKVKLKSLAEESKIIRHEKNHLKRNPYAGSVGYINGLHWHRIDHVRVEARATLLAYQYLRGIPYSVCEPGPKSEPAWDKVKRMVKMYGGVEFDHEKWKNGEQLRKAA